MTIGVSLPHNLLTSPGGVPPLLPFPGGQPLTNSGAQPQHVMLVLTLHGGPGVASAVTSRPPGAPAQSKTQVHLAVSRQMVQVV